jgi:hypothetical protein
MIRERRAHNLDGGSIEWKLAGFAAHAVSAEEFFHQLLNEKNDCETNC